MGALLCLRICDNSAWCLESDEWPFNGSCLSGEAGDGPGRTTVLLGTTGCVLHHADVSQGSTEKSHISREELSLLGWVIHARRHLTPTTPASIKKSFAANPEAKFKSSFTRSCLFF